MGFLPKLPVSSTLQWGSIRYDQIQYGTGIQRAHGLNGSLANKTIFLVRGWKWVWAFELVLNWPVIWVFREPANSFPTTNGTTYDWISWSYDLQALTYKCFLREHVQSARMNAWSFCNAESGDMKVHFPRLSIDTWRDAVAYSNSQRDRTRDSVRLFI